MRKQYRPEHFSFRNLLRARLDHHNGVARSRNCKLHAAELSLEAVGVNYVFAVDIAYAHGARWAHERRLAYA